MKYLSDWTGPGQARHLCRRNLRDELETLAVVRLLGPLGGAAAHPVRVGREQRL